MNFELAWPWLLAALPLPLLALLLPRVEVCPTALKVPFFHALQAQLPTLERKRSHLKTGFALLIWMLLVLAACRPQWVGEPLLLPVSGRDLLLAVDISGSMRVDDMQIDGQRVDRLSAVKAVAGEFIQRREGDRIGLILFGRNAYLQAPLTFDRKTVRQLLNESALGLAGKETAIGDAIGLGVKRLREEAEQNRVLILLTDGANSAGVVDPLKAGDLAAREGIRIYTIGVGAESRVVQDFFGSRRIANGELDEKTLQALAAKTGGRYFRASNTDALQQIYTLLDELEPAAEELETFRPVRELYFWPLAAGLLLSVLLAIAPLWSTRRKPVVGEKVNGG